MTLTVICSWCKKLMKQGDAPADAPVSHGCCRDCAKKHFPLHYEEVEKALREDGE